MQQHRQTAVTAECMEQNNMKGDGKKNLGERKTRNRSVGNKQQMEIMAFNAGKI